MVLVCFGIGGLFGWPPSARDLNDNMPGFSWFLIASGLLLLPFTAGLIDQRLIVGPAIVIALGVLVFWRRRRRDDR
jgi:hypothetical protein